jgi:hypothetical protein
MGSILSQAAEKCYLETKKTERAGGVRGILLLPERFALSGLVRSRTTPLRPPSLEAS